MFMLNVVLLLGFFLALTQAEFPENWTEECAYKNFPVYAGGQSNEFINCVLYDPNNEMIYVTGNTTSSDFAPAANDHGFAYALDINGDWVWGKFFYNVSYAISDISGCSLSSSEETLVLFGMGNSQPIVLEVDPLDGEVISYISMEMVGTSDTNVPVFYTYDGAFKDDDDHRDGQAYFYLSFVMNDHLEILRILQEDEDGEPDIDWNFDYFEEQTKYKVPRFLREDMNDDQMFYLAGQHDKKGSVMRFRRRNGELEWYIKFDQILELTAFRQDRDTDFFYGCGHDGEGVTEQTQLIATDVHMFKVDEEGDIKMYQKLPMTSTYEYCKGIVHDENNQQFTILLETNNMNLRPLLYDTLTNPYDLVLLNFKEAGDFVKGYQITNYDGDINLWASYNSLFKHGESYIFGGYSFGFKTEKQYAPEPVDESYYNVYVQKFQFDMGGGYSCVYNQEVDDTLVGITEISNNEETYVVEVDDYELFDSYDRQLIAYSSQYAGGFTLLNQIYIPRPCASFSYNLTTLNYSRGQNELSYDIVDVNDDYGYLISMMYGHEEYVYQNGTTTDNIAYYDRDTASVYVQTDDEDNVDTHMTIIRACDNINRLLELHLYVNVSENTYPDFVEDIETSWTIELNETFTYKLPDLEDPEGNDEPEIFIGEMEGQDYPDFLELNTDSMELNFYTEDIYQAGYTYYFTLTVKEQNSETVSYTYYCTVRVNGTKITRPEPVIYYTDYSMELTWLDNESRGSLVFSPENGTLDYDYMVENWDEYFDVYMHNVDYVYTGERIELLDFVIDNVNPDNQTINFTCTFNEPYMLGLLVKRNDTLYIEMRNDTNYSSLFLGNSTEQRFYPDAVDGERKTSIRIDLQFDLRDERMGYLRQKAREVYWVVLGLIFCQFWLLYFRNIGFLTLWALIEYMQLVAYMPMYNFRLIPYLYYCYRPFQTAHMILFNESYFMVEFDDDFFNEIYRYYEMPVGKLMQACGNQAILISIVILFHVVLKILSFVVNKNSTIGKWVFKTKKQYSYNIYIRLYMLSYFDLTFFSIMKIVEGNNTTYLRKIALLVSYVIFVLSIVFPVFFVSLIFKRFDMLKIKQAKESFNTLILRIDKASKSRVANPGYFFGRRMLTAVLLTLPIDNTFIFLQYVFILMSSHSYILFLVASKPYQTPGINTYILANETFYSAMIIAIFIFSDATPELHIKLAAATTIILSLFLMIFSNMLVNIIFLIRGRASLKKQIKEYKLKRAEKEALERAEEEERKLKKRRDEEEFTKLADDTGSITANDVNSTYNNTTMAELNLKSKKRGDKKGKDGDVLKKKGKRKGKGKGKDDDADDLEEYEPDSKPKKGKKNKDNLGTFNMAGIGDKDYAAPSNNRKRRNKQKKQDAEDLEDVDLEDFDDDKDKKKKENTSSDANKKTKSTSDDKENKKSSDGQDRDRGTLNTRTQENYNTANTQGGLL